MAQFKGVRKISQKQYNKLKKSGKLDTGVIYVTPDKNLKLATGEVAPTTETVGEVGLFYLDTNNKKLYQCVSVTTDESTGTTTYEWQAVGSDVDTSNLVTKEEFDNIYNHNTHTLTVQNIELNGEDLNTRISTTETTLTEITPDVMRALKTPMSTPTNTELVAVDNTGAQTMLEIGDGLSVENGTLKASGGVTINGTPTAVNFSSDPQEQLDDIKSNIKKLYLHNILIKTTTATVVLQVINTRELQYSTLESLMGTIKIRCTAYTSDNLVVYPAHGYIDTNQILGVSYLNATSYTDMYCYCSDLVFRTIKPSNVSEINDKVTEL